MVGIKGALGKRIGVRGRLDALDEEINNETRRLSRLLNRCLS
jgi:hypothetical protein